MMDLAAAGISRAVWFCNDGFEVLLLLGGLRRLFTGV